MFEVKKYPPPSGLRYGDRRDVELTEAEGARRLSIGRTMKWLAIAFVVGVLWMFAPLANAVLSWSFKVPCIFCNFGHAQTISGRASWYGSESGNRTASGQRFNPAGMTAAHRSLPFGTRLRVTYRGCSVIVTVNDRGPFIRGRVLDLSAGAARAIGMHGAGVGHITAEVLR